ncbi:MAG: AMP-binding protein [Chlorobium sp.]|uniref:AMP-binding protein n=1 Tax=Chlorobium sp. TaxID=1095 RepID=UPI0025B8EF4C|nr:AMP-binding protein [Chlorobium sp.]MCF8383084.1 AMP-binding protein [Chlorobium sp.]
MMKMIATSPEQKSRSLEGKAIEAIGILASNSTGFIREMFSAYAKGQIVVPLQSREFAKRLKGIIFSDIVEPSPEPGWFTEKQTFRTDDTLAQISFTSGTEGEPKGIALTYKALADVIERLNGIMEIDSSIKEYVGVPVYYSFGFGRFRACSMVGGKAYIPPKGFDPFEISTMLRKGEINAISTVPSLWRILLANPEVIGTLGKNVLWIEIGSQYMSRQEKEAMKLLFPRARIVQHYGLTEASRSTLLDISSTEGPMLESVGKALGKTELRLTSDARIQIKGPHIATGTISENGIFPLADTDGWLTTTDLGAIENDYLFFKGRADDVINCSGIKLYPEQIETKLLKALDIKTGIAVTRVPDALRGDGFLIAFTKDAGQSRESIIAATSDILAKLNVHAGEALHVIEIDTIPRTETGKIQRKLLTERFTAEKPLTPSVQEPPLLEEDQTLTEEQRSIVAIWEDVLGIRPVSIHTSFFDLGGDSLSSLKMMLKLEKAGIPRKTAQAFFEGKTIAEITNGNKKPASENDQTSSTEQHRVAHTSDAINATRGLMVLWLVAIHWLPGVWERLPEIFSGMNTLLNPAYRLGTPGFAIVFGLNVGFFFFHQLENNAALATKNIRFASKLVAGGILLLAAINFATLSTGQTVLTVPLPTFLFYSVLLYYFLAVNSIRLWYQALSGFGDKIMGALVTSVIFFALGMLFKAMLPETQSIAGLNLLRLMMKANYNYFTMSGTVMLGVATGIHLRKHVQSSDMEKVYTATGLLLFLFGIIISLDSGTAQEWFTMVVAHIWAIQVYFGLTLMLLAAFMHIRKKHRNPFYSRSTRFLSIAGILSLPMYVGHSMVIPSKDMLVGVGMAPALALAIPMLLFFGAIGYTAKRISSVYGSTES